MWARVLSNPMKFEKLFAEDRGGIIWVELRRDAAKVGREDDRYRRAVSAAEAGYSVYDVEFYSTRMLGHLLPALVEADFDASRAMETASAATDAAGVHVRVSDPFSGAENYLVVLVDVAGAYGRLPEGMQRLLKTYFSVNQEDTDEGRWARDGLASSMGITGENLRQRVHRALERLQGELGGADPWT